MIVALPDGVELREPTQGESPTARQPGVLDRTFSPRRPPPRPPSNRSLGPNAPSRPAPRAPSGRNLETAEQGRARNPLSDSIPEEHFGPPPLAHTKTPFYVICGVMVVVVVLFLTGISLTSPSIPPPEGWNGAKVYRVGSLAEGTDSLIPKYAVTYRNAIYFAATKDSNRALWKFDGSKATKILSMNPMHLTVHRDKLWFSASRNQSAGRELWRWSPEDGLEEVVDVRPGTASSNPQFMTGMGTTLYFRANGGDGSGEELWAFNSTHGAFLVVDIFVGAYSSFPTHLASNGTTLFFAADDGNYRNDVGRELWAWSEERKLWRVANIRRDELSSSPTHLVMFQNVLYFQATALRKGAELWSWDPVNRLQYISNVYRGADSGSPTFMTPYHGKLWYAGLTSDTVGRELLVWDPIRKQRIVIELGRGALGGRPQQLVVLNNKLYFTADGLDGAGREWWVYESGSTGSITAKYVADPEFPMTVGM